MSEPEPGPKDDPWMTIAEFAEEMRVRPVTVRSWISKGQLRATRGGRRKWLVRRSELTRMLEQGDAPTVPAQPPAASGGWSDWDERPPEMWEQLAKRAEEDARAAHELEDSAASYEWSVALDQSRMAPPDARFAGRIRHIAQAAQYRAAVLTEGIEDPSFVWRPEPGSRGLTLSYELRPGGNRPGPKDAWDRVDRVVARLGVALEGTSASAAASAFSDLAAAMNDVAAALENRPPRSLGPDDGGGPNDDGATE